MQKPGFPLSEYKYYLLLALFVLLAFWPLTFTIFSLKNDALIYFLPYRYHVSEAIQQGYFPWWNPYLYTGVPLHGDMQSGVWNPVVMIISLFTRYNMSVLQWEVLLYLIIAAIGMFKLVRAFNNAPLSSLIIAMAYACCGFMTDSGSIVPWITSAAYLPFVILYFYRLVSNPSLRSSALLALALVLLITAGYPSFFIYTSYILLAGFIARTINLIRNKKSTGLFHRYSFVAFALFLMISSPALMSWWDFLSYYARGSGAGLNRSLSNSFPVFSSLSYLIPSAVSREHPWLMTDLSARNASIGIFLFIFFVASFTKRISAIQKFILAIIIFSFLFSLGHVTPLREWCYQYIPLMNSFRHPASIRIFTTMGMLLMAAPALNQWLAEATLRSINKKIFYITVSAGIIVAGFIIANAGSTDFLQSIGSQPNKKWLDSLGFPDMVVLLGAMQLLFLGAFLWTIRRPRRKLVAGLIIVNTVLCCWIALPFTFISQVKTKTVNHQIAAFPDGYPIPDISDSVAANSYYDSIQHPGLLYESFYSKKIKIQDYITSPTINTDYISFLQDTRLRELLDNYPFIYLSDSSVNSSYVADESVKPQDRRIVFYDKIGRQQIRPQHTSGMLTLTDFSPQTISLHTNTRADGMLNIFQQYHHGWQIRVDDELVYSDLTNHAFMSIKIPAGVHTVSFSFKPHRYIMPCVFISVFSILALIAYFIFRSVKPYRRHV